MNIAVAFPGLLLALFFAVIFGVGATGAVLAIGLAGAPSFARLCQTLIASVGARDFITAARIAGVSRGRLLTRHVLPNIGEPLVVNATIGAGGALLAFAGLSFLGLGVQSPAYDWGRLLQDGLTNIYLQPVGALGAGAGHRRRRARLQPVRRDHRQGLRHRDAWTGPWRLRQVADAAPGDVGTASAAPEDGAEPVAGQGEPVLDVQDLMVTFPTEGGIDPTRPGRVLPHRPG